MTSPAAPRPVRGAPHRRGRPALHAVPAGEPTERDRQRRFFETFLRATTNNRGRPYNERSIGAYRDGVISLDRYLTEIGFTGGFETVEVGTLNDYFRDYRLRHSQGGTVTKQRNLAVFFAWLAAEYETANPYDGKALTRYRRDEDVAPPVLSDALIAALLKVTSGRDYESVRDHAIIRLFLTGMR
jgi:site-specific recombinase XerD